MHNIDLHYQLSGKSKKLFSLIFCIIFHVLPQKSQTPQRPECKHGSFCSIFHKLSGGSRGYCWLKDYITSFRINAMLYFMCMGFTELRKSSGNRIHDLLHRNLKISIDHLITLTDVETCLKILWIHVICKIQNN